MNELVSQHRLRVLLLALLHDSIVELLIKYSAVLLNSLDIGAQSFTSCREFLLQKL